MVFIPTDPFCSANLRAGRAHEHAEELITQIEAFFSEHPWDRVTEDDADGIYEIHKIQFTQRFPPLWSLLVTEIIEHLRAALDHATYAAALLGGAPADTMFAVFPFSSDAAKFDNRMRGVAKDLAPEIQTLLRTFKPYTGGNDLLCSLNDLCNSSKHGLIQFVGGATANFSIQGGKWNGPVEFFNPMIWESAENHIKFAKVRKGQNFEHNAQLSIYVALDGVEFLRGVPATGIFDRFGCEVQGIIDAIEAECRRLSFIA